MSVALFGSILKLLERLAGQAVAPARPAHQIFTEFHDDVFKVPIELVFVSVAVKDGEFLKIVVVKPGHAVRVSHGGVEAFPEELVFDEVRHAVTVPVTVLVKTAGGQAVVRS